MTDINQIILVGRLTADADMRFTASGQALCKFSIAVNRRVKNNEQWTDEASFFDLTLWGQTAESVSKHLIKGAQVVVSGELRQERWEKNGQKFSKIFINVDKLQLGPRGKQSDHATTASQPDSKQTHDAGPQPFDDDIPF